MLRTVRAAPVILALALTGCAAASGDQPGADGGPAEVAGVTEDLTDGVTGGLNGPLDVEHDETHVWVHLGSEVGPSTDADPLAGPAGAVLAAELNEPETVFVHAVARPGGHRKVAVLAVTRTQTEAVLRYDLRYVVFDEAGRPGALYAFPWRLQIDERHPGTLDRVPIPVWAPDGDALAWVEWDGDEVRLQTVGWFDDGVSSNPSDDVATYRLTETPPGVQLDRWDREDGQAVLTGMLDDVRWRFLIDPDAGSVVIPQVPAIALAGVSSMDGATPQTQGVVP